MAIVTLHVTSLLIPRQLKSSYFIKLYFHVKIVKKMSKILETKRFLHNSDKKEIPAAKKIICVTKSKLLVPEKITTSSSLLI